MTDTAAQTAARLALPSRLEHLEEMVRAGASSDSPYHQELAGALSQARQELEHLYRYLEHERRRLVDVTEERDWLRDLVDRLSGTVADLALERPRP